MPILFSIWLAMLPVDTDSAFSGHWAAELQTPGGPIEFGFQLEQHKNTWTATILNPLEPIKIPVVEVSGQQIHLRFPHYDSALHAELKDGRLVGQWIKKRGGDETASMPFKAKPKATAQIKPAEFEHFAGRWRVQFSESSDPAIGQFQLDAAHGPWGTFLTTTGDYRFLVVQGLTTKTCRLSCFDGAHAFLFDMQLQPDESLTGNFWSGTTWHETWTAVRDKDAVLPDAFQQTVVLQDAQLNSIGFPDLTGQQRLLSDPEFAGQCRIIQVFGSWCPNCHDAALYLKELNEKYSDQGLKIVGLAFEHTGDFDRDVLQVQRYIKRHQTPYPVLLAGTSDKSDATDQLQLLDRVRSYPTTVFMNREGQVKAVYTGFSGPATGEAHQRLRKRFEQTIERILNE